MINLLDYGYLPLADGGETAKYTPARVTAVHKERYELAAPQGICFGRLKGSIFFRGNRDAVYPTTGDFVGIQYNPDGDSLIISTLPRRSFFSRRDPTPGRGEQAVAANFDYVFAITSLNQEFNIKRLERYMSQGLISGATPVVILTKADLAADNASQLAAAQQVAAGCQVIPVSAHTGFGLDQLKAYIAPRKTIVLLGSSGVGKSSLVNALAGEEIMKTNTIRETDARGHHTTTHRQLILMPSGAMIIDTPGMRELGMWDAREGVGEAFADVEALLGGCRFSNCSHGSEPGCIIRAALEDGTLDKRRWKAYQLLLRESAAGHPARKQR